MSISNVNVKVKVIEVIVEPDGTLRVTAAVEATTSLLPTLQLSTVITCSISPPIVQQSQSFPAYENAEVPSCSMLSEFTLSEQGICGDSVVEVIEFASEQRQCANSSNVNTVAVNADGVALILKAVASTDAKANVDAVLNGVKALARVNRVGIG